jgi:hypothetical protein
VKSYTEICIEKGTRKKIQTLASCQKASEDKTFEQVIRCGLEAYLVEQAAKADTAVVPSSVPLSGNANGI